MRVRLLTLKSYTFIQVRGEDTRVKFVKKVLVFMLRFPLEFFRFLLREADAKERKWRASEKCRINRFKKILVIGKTATLQIESLSVESPIVRKWFLHPKCAPQSQILH